MIFKCPGSQSFSQPHPEFINCPFCNAEVEIWTDENKAICPKCKKDITRELQESCLEWCKYAKECVGTDKFEEFMRGKNIMLSEKMYAALNHQVNREIYSAYFYLGMASYASSGGFKGTANWFRKQVKEETAHAEKLYEYVVERQGRVMLGAIEEPPQDFSSIFDLFTRTLEHEKKVTKMIHDLVKLAESEKDEKSKDFLQWFVKEQVEEEENASKVLGKVSAAGEDKSKLLKVDAELSKRK